MWFVVCLYWLKIASWFPTWSLSQEINLIPVQKYLFLPTSYRTIGHSNFLITWGGFQKRIARPTTERCRISMNNMQVMIALPFLSRKVDCHNCLDKQKVFFPHVRIGFYPGIFGQLSGCWTRSKLRTKLYETLYHIRLRYWSVGCIFSLYGIKQTEVWAICPV